MKKGLKLLLSAAFALSIAGCANGSSNDDKTIKIGATSYTACGNLKMMLLKMS